MAQSNYHIYQKKYLKENKLSAAVMYQVEIDKPVGDVWEVVSNWGDAYVYTPGLDYSYCFGDKTGKKSRRHCDIGKGYVKEEVLLWEEGKRFIQQVYEIGKIPMIKKIVVELEVEAISENKTKLYYFMAYKMPLGKLMKGSIHKNIKTNAYATKHFIETKDASVAKNPKKLKELYF